MFSVAQVVLVLTLQTTLIYSTFTMGVYLRRALTLIKFVRILTNKNLLYILKRKYQLMHNHGENFSSFFSLNMYFSIQISIYHVICLFTYVFDFTYYYY